MPRVFVAAGAEASVWVAVDGFQVELAEGMALAFSGQLRLGGKGEVSIRNLGSETLALPKGVLGPDQACVISLNGALNILPGPPRAGPAPAWRFG